MSDFIRIYHQLSTNQFHSFFKVKIKSLTVSVAIDTEFDIFRYFGLDVPPSLIEEWDFDNPLPLRCKAECLLISDGRPITYPVTLSSKQYSHSVVSLPDISVSHFVSRHVYCFDWDKPSKIPIIVKNKVSL